jgi:hypothetical protein
MGFFRGERNWLMLFAGGEPTILRVEDSALRNVMAAVETYPASRSSGDQKRLES